MKRRWYERQISLLGVAAVIVMALVVASCYPGDVTSAQQLDTVVTQYDTEYNFSKNGTYAMPDVVIHVCEIDELDPPSDCIDLGHDHDQLMLNLVVSNMNDLGYTRIPFDQITEANKPDVAVVIWAIGTNNWQAWVNYWPGWGWCCGPGWGWYYPPTVSVTNYQTGTIHVEMADTNLVPPDGSEALVIEWTGTLNGLLSSSSNTSQRVTDGINQMFTQSQYLNSGN